MLNLVLQAHHKRLVALLDSTWDAPARLEHTVLKAPKDDTGNSSTTLYLALEHASSAVRVTAVRKIADAISGGGTDTLTLGEL